MGVQGLGTTILSKLVRESFTKMSINQKPEEDGGQNRHISVGRGFQAERISAKALRWECT